MAMYSPLSDSLINDPVALGYELFVKCYAQCRIPITCAASSRAVRPSILPMDMAGRLCNQHRGSAKKKRRNAFTPWAPILS